MDVFASTFGGPRHFLRCKAPHEHIPWVAYSIQRTGRVAERCGSMSEGSIRSRAHSIGCKIVSTFYRSVCYNFSNTHSLAFTGIAFRNWLEQRVLQGSVREDMPKSLISYHFERLSIFVTKETGNSDSNHSNNSCRDGDTPWHTVLGFGASSTPNGRLVELSKAFTDKSIHFFALWDLHRFTKFVMFQSKLKGTGSVRKVVCPKFLNAEGWERLLKTFLRNSLTTFSFRLFFHKNEGKNASFTDVLRVSCIFVCKCSTLPRDTWCSAFRWKSCLVLEKFLV